MNRAAYLWQKPAIMYHTLLTSLENQIFTITINRPDKLNALNKEVFADLNKALDEVYSNPAIRSVIITGAGPKAFVAGADISEFNSLTVAASKALAKAGQDTFFQDRTFAQTHYCLCKRFCAGWWMRAGDELPFQDRIGER
eukprot:Opistho-2@56509